MDKLTPASEKGLAGKGATPASDSTTPHTQHGNQKDNETGSPTSGANKTPVAATRENPFARSLSTRRTPAKQSEIQPAVESTEGATQGNNDDGARDKSKACDLSPDLAFLRSLSSSVSNSEKQTGIDSSKLDDVVFVSVTPNSESDKLLEDPFQTMKKRKRNNGLSPEEKLMHEIEPSANLVLLNKQVLELIQFGQDNQNVHKQVKALARTLRSTIEKVTLDYKHAEFQRRESERARVHTEKQLYHRIEELETEMEQKASSSSNSKNVCPKCGNNVSEDINLNDVHPDDLETFKSLIARQWPGSAFKRTKLEGKDILGKIPDHVVILSDKLFTDKEKGITTNTSKLEREILTQFPELDREAPTRCPGGYSVTLEEVTLCRIKGTNKNIEKKRTVSLVLRHDNVGDNLEKIHAQLLETKKIMIEAETSEATLIAPAYIDCKTFQKIVECVLSDTNIMVIIVAEKVALGSYATATRGNMRKNRCEALIVEATDDKGYDSLLGTLRDKLNVDSAAGITGVKKTGNGNLLLQIRRDAKADELRAIVGDILETDKIRATDGLTRKTLLIRGIDAMATIEEIRESFVSICRPEHTEKIKMTVNKNIRGEQTAVLTMVSTDADKALNLRSVRIGFSDCRMQERIKVDRCFKCWQFGHNARACQDQVVNMSNCCFKCGQPGHHKSTCPSKVEFCPTCGVEGHQSATGGCRSYREAMSKERRRRRDSVPSASVRTTND